MLRRSSTRSRNSHWSRPRLTKTDTRGYGGACVVASRASRLGIRGMNRASPGGTRTTENVRVLGANGARPIATTARKKTWLTLDGSHCVSRRCPMSATMAPPRPACGLCRQRAACGAVGAAPCSLER